MHIAARVMATAGPGEIVVSRTVRDLVAGSDVALQDRGSQRLKGVEVTGSCSGWSVADPALSSPSQAGRLQPLLRLGR